MCCTLKWTTECHHRGTAERSNHGNHQSDWQWKIQYCSALWLSQQLSNAVVPSPRRGSYLILRHPAKSSECEPIFFSTHIAPSETIRFSSKMESIGCRKPRKYKRLHPKPHKTWRCGDDRGWESLCGRRQHRWQPLPQWLGQLDATNLHPNLHLQASLARFQILTASKILPREVLKGSSLMLKKSLSSSLSRSWWWW
jgi:hypothetical protein